MVKERSFTAVTGPNFLVRCEIRRIEFKILLLCSTPKLTFCYMAKSKEVLFLGSGMQEKLMSKKKPSFPVSERFHRYLAKYNQKYQNPCFL